MRLVWAQYALEDRRAIYDHIELDDAHAAALVDIRITEAVARLIDFPESGRPGRVDGTRELVVGRTSCVVAYRVIGETVRILRVLHGAQLWPDDLPDG
ncbi:type II toxin-antitoxin system RelE/ParE family toxin [Phenylobacterium sp.]|uniref:type II toxin-antitoxin system RelE/ParE family toxin n=1 Tax=Phenylobacterium sp. TaxID=1871053 RepID=UPI0035B09EF6